MKRRPEKVSRGTLTALVSLLASCSAMSQALQDLHIGMWEGSLDIGYGIDREHLRSSDDAQQTDFSRRRTHERINIRNDGFYFADPQLASGNLGLSWDLVQDREASGGASTSSHARLVGYAFDAALLAGLPYNAKLFANRTQNLLNQPFGRTDLAFENRGMTLQLREDSPLRDRGLPYFSASMRLEQQRTHEMTTSVLGQGFQRDERQTLLGLDAHKGYETADLDLHYQASTLSDSGFSRAAFRSQSAAVNYSLDFGPLLERRWDSRVSSYRRSGIVPISVLTVDENLHIDHQRNLATNYQVLFARTTAQASVNTLDSATFNVRYEPYQNLSGNAQASALRQHMAAGKRASDAAQLALQYRYRLPGNGSLSLRAGGRQQVDDNRLSASSIDVVDEAHAAPSPLGTGAGFLLAQPFAIASSIVVVDLRAGARLPAVLGVDYEVVPEGSFARIVPLATSAVIQAGDPLAIGYTYEIDPSIRYGTASRSASVSVEYRWISASVAHEQSKQKLLSGADSRFLQDQRKDSTRIDVHDAWGALSAQGSAEYVRYASTLLNYDMHRLNALATYRPARDLSLRADADHTVTNFELPSHRTDSLSAHLSLDWYAESGWLTTALVGRRVFKDTLQPTESIDEARVQSRLSYGMLELAASLNANRRTRAGFVATTWAAELTATRRF